MELAEDLRPGAEHPNIFDLQLTREDVAASLEEIAEQAATIAKMFRDPQVDERDSPLVGYDAAHSLSR